MAIWQFTVELIPRDWADNHGFDPAILYKKGVYSTRVAWNGIPYLSEIGDELSGVMPKAMPWNNNMLYWGDPEGHDVKIFIDQGKINGIVFRLSLYLDTGGMLSTIVQLSEMLDCIVFYPELGLLEVVSEATIEKAIKRSGAALVCRKFLEKRSSMDELSTIDSSLY